MTPPRSRPVVVIAMNAFRAGGSQSYAFSLASMLQSRGFAVVLVAKRGEWSAAARRVARVRHVVWREGVADQPYGWARKAVLQLAEFASRIRLATIVRRSTAVISSQPGPGRFFRDGRSIWPRLRHMALVHGTTAVEWPIFRTPSSIDSLHTLIAATPEVRDMLVRAAPATTIELMGNIFSADLFWGRPNRSAQWQSSGPVTFLGTLTPNKTAPLAALIEQARSLSTRLVIIGDGSDRTRLENLAGHFEVGDLVSFVGAQEDPRPWIEAAGVLLTAGRGAIESISGGRPTVVATSDGLHGVVREADLDALIACNFTGRSAASSRDYSHIARVVETARAQTPEQLSALELRLSTLGSLSGLLRQLDAAT